MLPVPAVLSPTSFSFRDFITSLKNSQCSVINLDVLFQRDDVLQQNKSFFFFIKYLSFSRFKLNNCSFDFLS